MRASCSTASCMTASSMPCCRPIPKVEGLTLANRIAQEHARELLETADEYF